MDIKNRFKSNVLE